MTEMVVSEGFKPDTVEYEDRMMELRSRLVALASNQAHSSTAKGALLAGTRFRSVEARLEDNLEMTGERLRAVLEGLDRDKLTPYFITLGLGTTNSCAVDRFREIKAVLAEKEHWKRIWVHIDAAYAGAALVADEWQYISKEFAEGVDSFNLNMHKWLLVNFDARLVAGVQYTFRFWILTIDIAASSSATAKTSPTPSTSPPPTCATTTPTPAR